MKAFLEQIKAVLASWGPIGIFVICVVDGAGLPNPSGPDLMLTLYAAADPKNAYLAAILGVAGSMLGNFILYSLARKGGELYLRKHSEGEKGRKFREWFNHYGLVTVFVPALIPIPTPLKFFVICSGALRVNPAHFLAVLGGARTVRYLGMAWLGKTLGENSMAWIKAHTWHFVGGALGLVGLLFLLIRIGEKRRLDPAR
jgi:membrane protein YqaA with SNARE-associated domain